MKSSLPNDFHDDLAKFLRWKELKAPPETWENVNAETWENVNEVVKDYWRKESQPLLEFLGKKGVLIKTPGGLMALDDLLANDNPGTIKQAVDNARRKAKGEK